MLKGPCQFDFNCHCHSCVSVMRHLDKKFPNAASAAVEHGVGKSFWLLKDITLPPGDDLLAFINVGSDGKKIRSYTTCCGTLFNTAGGAVFRIPARPLSRNNVRSFNGAAYTPKTPPTNVLTKHSFGDYTLPENSYEERGPVLATAFGKMGEATETSADARWFKTSEDVAESVDITWE